MIRFSKKAISFLTALVLLFTLSVSALGTEKISTPDSSICSNIVSALYDLDKSTYGFDNIDLSQITIGDAISSYEHTNGGLRNINYILYPLSYKGKLIAFAIKIVQQI